MHFYTLHASDEAQLVRPKPRSCISVMKSFLVSDSEGCSGEPVKTISVAKLLYTTLHHFASISLDDSEHKQSFTHKQ